VTYKQIAETLNTSEEEALGIFKWWQKEGIIK
jgi:DNA-binding Lrp family transcriptional regulator